LGVVSEQSESAAQGEPAGLSRRDQPGGPQTRANATRPIRVTIVQPALAKYRIPVFRELARRPGIELRVVFGSVKGLDNVDAEGFNAIASHRRRIGLGGVGMNYNLADWTYASRQYSDVIILQWTPRSLSVVPALLRAKAAGLPRILWGHGYAKDERGRRSGARKMLARLATAMVFWLGPR
jgi:hypothetical protein